MTAAQQNRVSLNRAKLIWFDTATKAQAAGVDIRPWLPRLEATASQVENLAEGLRQQYEGEETYAGHE